jgi:hypothetical protein
MNNAVADSNPADGALPQDEFLDLDPVMRSVAAQYGRAMFALVHNAGMAGEAAKVLGALVAKHQSQHSAHALGVLVAAFNQASNSLCLREGWTQEQLAHCERDIQLAWKGKLIVPGSAIILDS